MTEDFLYYSRKGELLGYHSKIALPEQDSVVLKGASGITPETNYERACRVIEIPELGIRVGTVFCWQVYFTDFWAHLMRQRCSPWPTPSSLRLEHGTTRAKLLMEATRIGFKQNKGSDDPKSDPRPGSVSCSMKANSSRCQLRAPATHGTVVTNISLLWDGWMRRHTGRHLFHLPSTAEVEQVVVTEYDAALFDALPNFPYGYEPGYDNDDFKAIAAKKKMRKSINCEMRAENGKAAGKVETL